MKSEKKCNHIIDENQKDFCGNCGAIFLNNVYINNSYYFFIIVNIIKAFQIQLPTRITSKRFI